jgi:hypothetical protein
MDPMEPIAGVSLQQYAELCAAMAHTGDDVAAQVAIARERGVDEGSWNAAKDGWTARMQDPALQGKVAHAFVPLYSAAQAAARGGAEPCTLEHYTKVVAEYSFLKDADGNQVPVDQVLGRYGYDRTSWAEVTGYWTPKVNDPADPAAAKFRELMQAESDRIFGIVREKPAAEPAPAADPEPEAKPAQDEGVVGMVMGWFKSLVG